MKKRKKFWIKIFLVLIPVIIVIILLCFRFLRFNQPFNTVVKQWDEITIYNYLQNYEPLKITDSEQIAGIYAILGETKVTTVGLGTDRNGFGLLLTNENTEITLYSDMIMYKAIRYRVADQTYLDRIRDYLDGIGTHQKGRTER